MRRFLLFTLIASLLLWSVTATAAAKTPSLKSLAKTVAALRQTVGALEKKVDAQAKTITKLRARVGSAEMTIAAQKEAITSLQNSTVMALNQYLMVTAAGSAGAVNGVIGPNIVLWGCNLQVRSSGTEDDSSGTGNAIVGWNVEPDPLPSPFRTGSNNLVVGHANNFTGSGCLVAGAGNTVSGDWASVSGGRYNTASGDDASVSGGGNNTAMGWLSSISGGHDITNNNTCGWSGGSYNSP